MSHSWPTLGRELNDFNGDWSRYEEHCYELYYQDFHRTKPPWPVQGVRFAIKRMPEYEGKTSTFWHIVSEGQIEAERLPNLRRCARITWPRQIIDEFCETFPARGSDRIVWWRNTRRNESRLLIALPDFSYLVVIAERGDYVLLWTAYPVDKSHQQRKLQREHDAYWAAGLRR